MLVLAAGLVDLLDPKLDWVWGQELALLLVLEWAQVLAWELAQMSGVG